MSVLVGRKAVMSALVGNMRSLQRKRGGGKKIFSSGKGDYVGMSEHLGKIDWHRLLSGVGVQG